MKKISVILGLLLFCSTSIFANEIDTKQTIDNNQTYFTANIQKQPAETKQKQGITNHFTFFTINVQINQKVKDNPDNNVK